MNGAGEPTWRVAPWDNSPNPHWRMKPPVARRFVGVLEKGGLPVPPALLAAVGRRVRS